MKKGAAAIILCAGKGTRMGDSTRNKVAFNCAGVPVIRRIVRNMREGGVERFVIVVGHRAESVMGALDGESGVLYAYQAEQKGTGHAAGYGLRVLEDIGYEGPVVISMGDKIVSPTIVRELLDGKSGAKAVLGVQRREDHPNGGHVMFDGDKPLGIIEYADAKQAEKTGGKVKLSGHEFSAAEIFATPYVNVAFYRFDAKALSAALQQLKSDNAQGEIYLTDTIERFAGENSLEIYRVERGEDMLTYSTRPELRAISRRFLRTTDELKAAYSDEQTAKTIAAFEARFGKRAAITTSAPGRINLMGRHIEHRGGSVNMMAIAARTVFVASPREDDIVNIANTDGRFPEASFRISDYLPADKLLNYKCQPSVTPTQTAAWLEFLDTPAIKADLESSRGHWVNYVKSAVLRFQASTDMPLCGMDIMACGAIPVAAGLSSSSAIVVATAEAIVALNALNVSTRDFVDLCGEGEWYVGSRGGAGDHAAMICSKKGYVTHLMFKPFRIGEKVKFPDEYAVVVIESGEQAKKSEGAREKFNSRIRDYEAAFSEVKRVYPFLPVAYFRDIAFLPEKDRNKALETLSGSVRGVAEFGVKECRRAEECLDLLKNGDYAGLGKMMKDSHDGDRLGKGEYECSTTRIDALCDRLNATPGVLGSQLVGAGLGGCVIALTAKTAAKKLVDELGADGYKAFVSEPSEGSKVGW